MTTHNIDPKSPLSLTEQTLLDLYLDMKTGKESSQAGPQVEAGELTEAKPEEIAVDQIPKSIEAVLRKADLKPFRAKLYRETRPWLYVRTKTRSGPTGITIGAHKLVALLKGPLRAISFEPPSIVSVSFSLEKSDKLLQDERAEARTLA